MNISSSDFESPQDSTAIGSIQELFLGITRSIVTHIGNNQFYSDLAVRPYDQTGELSDVRPVYSMDFTLGFTGRMYISSTVFNTVFSSHETNREVSVNLQSDDVTRKKITREFANALKKHYYPDKTQRVDYVRVRPRHQGDDFSRPVFEADLFAFVDSICSGQPSRIRFDGRSRSMEFTFSSRDHRNAKDMRTSVQRTMTWAIRDRIPASAKK